MSYRKCKPWQHIWQNWGEIVTNGSYAWQFRSCSRCGQAKKRLV